jgi:DNA-binding NarL/FixJ family response regulator
MTTPIRVQIMDDHDLIVEGLKSILATQPDMEVVFVPSHGEVEALDAIQRCHPDVLLLDARMPDFDLLSALEKIGRQCPSVRVIVVTAQQDPALVTAVASHGTAGYVLKEEGLSQLLPVAIREVARGQRWYSPRASQYLFQQPAAPAPVLTDYQYDVLRLMVGGKGPREIAQVLQRSVAAVYGAQEAIRERLGVATNQETIILAIREGLVPLAGEEVVN